MKLEDIRNVTVLGAGIMGSQIAQLFSQAGKYKVILYSRSQATKDTGMKSISERLYKYFVKSGKMTEDEMKEIVGRISGTTDFDFAIKDADLVVETVAEDMALKKNIFKQLSEQTRPETILLTNTSQLNITEIASATSRPDKVIGLHFFNPLSVITLLEVGRGALTSKETLDIVVELSKKLGKEPLVCKDFSFGFLANRAFTPMTLECVQMVWERVATPLDIDKALKLSYGLMLGPLEMADRIGLWKILAVSEPDKIRELGAEKGFLHPLIRMMVRAGYVGGPGKKGIYDFHKDVLSAD